MLKTRVIPCLLLRDGGLVKTVRFRKPTYVGDPINAVRIFNDKEVDELLLLDISASREHREPEFPLLERICRESFMPMGYGGGVHDLRTVEKLVWLGFEKVAVNSEFLANPDFIRRMVDVCGSQSVVVVIDVKKTAFKKVRGYDHVRGKSVSNDPVALARQAEELGAGEIVLNSVDRDGTMKGYDLDLLRSVTSVIGIPVIALGGAGSVADFTAAVKKGGASAVAAGSFFVFYGEHRAVLISYPDKAELQRAFA